MYVRYYGHLGKTTGYGRAAEQTCIALDTAGVNLDVQPFGHTGYHELIGTPLDERIQRALYQGGEPDLCIVHDLPMDVVKHCGGEEGSFLRHTDKPLVAYTTWEAETVPEAVIEPLVRCFDRIWVPSEANAKVFREAIQKHLGGDVLSPLGIAQDVVQVMPHAYDSAVRIERRAKASTEPYRFFWYGAWSVRKNPTGVIQAFVHAFAGRGDNVELVLHSQDLTPGQAAMALGSCGVAGKDSPVIKLSNGDKSIPDLLRECDCFVTAARGEAWNLPAFEASVIAGAQVISPHSLGSDDFLMSSSARFIGSQRAPAHVDVTGGVIDGGKATIDTRGAQGLTSACLWREPNLEQLAKQMREVYEKNERAISFGYNTAEKFGYEAVGKHARSLLQHLISDN